MTTAVAKLKKSSRLRPTLALVLGSGFHDALSALDVDARIAYTNIPGFPPVGVSGHAGELIFGHLGRTPVIVLCGRAHFYEGHSMERVTFTVRTLAAFGVRDLLLTNAAGGINRKFHPGDFMVLSDHINLMGVNPLRPSGRDASWPRKNATRTSQPPRFVDLTQVYDLKLSKQLLKAGLACKLKLHGGVYLAVSGPTYETPAEIRAYARLGADAVGMSTVPEAIVARQCGLRVAALSCITNLAAGISPRNLSHEEVLQTAKGVSRLAAVLLKKFAELYGQNGNNQ